jgi:hypothetical protein
MTKQKLLFIKKNCKNTEISHLHKYSDLFTQYFVEAPLAVITALSLLGYDAVSLAHLYFGEFLLFLSVDPLRLCQVGWGALLHSYFQVSPGILDRATQGSHS